MTEIILDIVGKIIAALFVGLVGCLVPKAYDWLSAKYGKENAELTMITVQSFVKAADQLLKADDPDGSKRKAYVVAEMEKLGVVVTERISAMIEAAVYDLPHGGAEK